MAVESSEIQRGEYLPRVADGLLTQALQSSGAVQIKGPKWCGKTATAIVGRGAFRHRSRARSWPIHPNWIGDSSTGTSSFRSGKNCPINHAYHVLI